MSKRRCIALDTLLTFWPPAPWARMALISTSDSSICSSAGAVAGLLRLAAGSGTATGVRFT